MRQEPVAPSGPRESAGAALLTTAQGLGLAAVAAAVTTVMTLSISDERQGELLALILAVIASVYVGVALAQERRAALGVEIVFATAVGALILLGLWASLYWLAAGYFAHGLWDIAHHRRASTLPAVALPRWYAPSCLLYDWAIGILVLAIA